LYSLLHLCTLFLFPFLLFFLFFSPFFTLPSLLLIL
jgi:hypothetical protein